MDKVKAIKKNKKVVSLSIKSIFLAFIFLFSFSSVVSAEDFGYNYLEGQLNTQQSINYSTIEVNNSQFLRGLTPQEVADLSPPTNPAGSDGYIQFNDNGTFGSNSDFFWDDSNERLKIGEGIVEEKLHIVADNTDEGIFLDSGNLTSYDRVVDLYTNTDSSIRINTGNDSYDSQFLITGNDFSLSPGRLSYRFNGFTSWEHTNGVDTISELMRLTYSSNKVKLGIGTLYPSAGLDIETTDNYGQIRIMETDSYATGIKLDMKDTYDNWRIQNNYGNFEIFDSTDNERYMKITQVGNVGFGTTSPQNRLDVEGGAVIGSSYAGVNTAPTDGLLVEGNVGIGSTTPLSKLHINGGTGSLSTGLTFGDGDSGIYESSDNAIVIDSDNVTINQGLVVGNSPNVGLGQGDISYSNRMFGNGSFSTFALKNGAGITVGDYDDQNDVRRSLLGTANFVLEEMILCDTTNPFTEDYEGRAGLVLFSVPNDYVNSNFFFDDYINSSCMTVSSGTFGKIIDENVSTMIYLSTPPPTFATMAEGYTVFNIRDNPESGFFINRKNATGFENFAIKMKSGVNGVTMNTYDFDMAGNNNNIFSKENLYSSEILNNTKLIKNLMGTDLSNVYGGSYYEYQFNLISNNETERTLFQVSPEYEDIIESGESIEIGSAYYDNTTSILDVTSNLTNVDELVTVYEEDDSILYFGNGENFTTVQFALDTESSADLFLVGYYCNSSGEWEELTITDNTNGLQSSGSINYLNPSNRGVCNKQINGTLFEDTTNHAYVAFQRTRNFLVTSPVVSLISISNGLEKMSLKKDVLRLIPRDTIPEICEAQNKGAIYFDNDEDTFCVCKSTGWKDMEDGSACT